MEETLTYWQHFEIFHATVRGISWPILVNVAIGLFCFAILRHLFFYATARKIDEWQNSSVFIWGIEGLFIYFIPDESENYENGKLTRVTVRGGQVVGGWVDAAAWTILGTILIWLWPIIFTIVILFGPIQMSRNHFMRKKLFVARLKGEELDL